MIPSTIPLFMAESCRCRRGCRSGCQCCRCGCCGGGRRRERRRCCWLFPLIPINIITISPTILISKIA